MSGAVAGRKLAPPGVVSVVEVFGALGLPALPHHTQVAGLAVGKLWRDMTGTETVQGKCRKTAGHGAHHQAVYPEDWRPRIEGVVRAVAGRPARQRNLKPADPYAGRRSDMVITTIKRPLVVQPGRETPAERQHIAVLAEVWSRLEVSMARTPVPPVGALGRLMRAVRGGR